MTTKRFSDNSQLVALAGTEVVPATSVAGGTDISSAAVPPGDDIKIPLAQLRAYVRRETVTTINVTTAGALTLDYSLGDYFIVNLGANVTSMTISNPPSGGGSIRVRFVQDATGSRTVVLPAAAKAITGTDTAVQSAAAAQSVLHLTTDNGGTSWGYSLKGVAA